jgi:hypothetical protein
LQTAVPFAGAGHACPHPPQLAALFVVSTQLPPQAVSPPQLELHVPFEHDSVTAQTAPHFPQLPGSVEVSTQAPLHSARPWSQTKPHTLALHDAVAKAGALQTVVQPPQCDASLVMSTQAPLQAVSPASHEMEQVLAVHVALPLVGAGQAWPQSPQLSEFCVTSTHDPEQALRTPGHTFEQPVGLQTSVAAQAVPHAAQFLGSVPRLAQVPLQLAKPESQAKSHLPALQAGAP